MRFRNSGKYQAAPTTRYVYGRRKNLITPTELEFFHILSSLIDKENYYTIPQVHLSTLLQHRIKGQNWYGALQHINRKSIDFAICTLKNLNPVCGIELDDKSHFRPDRKQRDTIVNNLFIKAKLPLLRIPVDKMRNKALLCHLLNTVHVPGNYFPKQ